MGSLMSGWNSTVLTDDKKVRLMRNRSLTNEEVEAFWRQHGRPDNSGQPGSPPGSPLPSPRRSDDEEITPLFQARRLDAIRSLPSSPLARGGHNFSFRSEPSSPATQRAESFHESGAAGSPPIITRCDWWTRSSSAFLNEPPHMQEETIGVSRRDREHKFAVARILTGNA